MLERYRPPFLDDDAGRSPERPDPLPELLRVRHRGRQAHHRDCQRQVDQDLLPHGAPVGVLEVVHLVHDHVLEPLQGGALLVEHVPEHLRGHDHHGRLGVDGVIPGQQTHPGGAVPGHEVPELLVRQGLQRGGVEGLPAGRQGPLHGVLGHYGLARAGGGGDQHRLPLVERADRFQLEVIERKRVVGLESFGVDHGSSLRAPWSAALQNVDAGDRSSSPCPALTSKEAGPGQTARTEVE